MNTELAAMTIIAHSGDSRSLAFEALAQVKKGNLDQANKLIAEAEQASLKAHKAQTDLLVAEAKGEAPEVNVLLVHSQDHLMTSILARELIAELIVLHNQKKDK